MLGTATMLGIGGATAAGGAIAGAIPKNESGKSWIDMVQQTPEGQDYRTGTNNLYKSLQALISNGPDSNDTANALYANRNLAQMYQNASQSGGLPSQSDISTSNDLAKSLFGAQQTALNQSFTQQNIEAQRLSARLGRSVDDPVLQAKLRTGFMNQQAQLDAQQGGWATNFALGLQDRRLGYAQQAAGVSSNLAYQAMQNRAALLGLGSQLEGGEFNQRLAQSVRHNEGTSGGGLSGAISGGLAGFGGGMQAASFARPLFGGGGMGGGGFGAPPSGNGFGPGSYSGYQVGPWAGGYGWGR